MNTTIKAQAFLQGYLHEKTAADPRWRQLDHLPVKPRVTPIVAAPGIPQTAPDPKVKPLFQDGKAKYKATQVVMPETSRERLIREGQAEAKRHRDAGTTPKQQEWNEGLRRRIYPVLDWMGRRTRELNQDGLGDWSFTPGSMNDQLLQNLSIPAADFVAIQKKKFEEDRPTGTIRDRGNKSKVLPRSDLISFDKRNQPVFLDTDALDHSPATYTESRRVVGLDPEELRKHPKGEWSPYPSDLRANFKGYHGYPETPEDGSAGRYKGGIGILGHEGTHNYTGGRDPADYVKRGYEGGGGYPGGTSYITDKGAEYTQGVTAGLNAMRDVTGEYLNDPQQVHQLFDEIVAKPSILDSISTESARVFRTYLYLRKTNPELAEKLRNSMALNSQYLVESERAGDPMVQKA
jgi:hypothetical protein